MSMAKRKSIKCTVWLNSRNGYTATPIAADSIADGLRKAKGSGWFRYRITDKETGKTIRQGFCE